MNTTRGIFESFPNQPAASPFAVSPEPAASPFTAVGRVDSPFQVATDAPPSAPPETGKPAKLPEKRKPSDSPFQVAEVDDGFGFEANPQVLGKSPFEVVPSPSPFSAEPASAAKQAAPAPFGGWPQPAVSQSPAPAPAPTPAPTPVSGADSDSFSIRQLELRAIFGVDRELGTDEIFQRCRALPGIRHVTRVNGHDMGTVDSMKQLLAGLGFGGSMRLYAGSVPVEFIREGNVMLAVQTDGGFAPGVRETLMIVARELGRLA